MIGRLAAAFLTVACLTGGSAAAAPLCAFPTAPRVLDEAGESTVEGGRLLQVWDAPDAPVFWSQADPPGYRSFRNRVREKAGPTDPVWLLAQTDYPNNAVASANARAWIGPATCLEKLIFQTQDRRRETFASPTEFLAGVLRSHDGKTLRVYFYTVNQDGIGRATPITDPVRADHAAGWQVLALAHNHNFHPGQPGLNAPLAPSEADAQVADRFARTAGLQASWITNGVDTVRIPANAFRQFKGADPR